MNPEKPGDLRNRQTLAVVAIVNLTECLVVDHDRAPLSGSVMAIPGRGGSENVLAQS